MIHCRSLAIFLAAAFLAAGLAGPVRAQPVRGPGQAVFLAQLEPEQRRMMRDQMREHWQQMPPEDRQRIREAQRERWQQMPSDDRQRMREEMRAGGREGRGRGGGYRGGH
jgi:uncharacterized membrane protein